MEHRTRKERLSKSAATGAVALIFMIIGFQAALFVVKVVERPASEEAIREADSIMRKPATDYAPYSSGGRQAGEGKRSNPARKSTGDSLRSTAPRTGYKPFRREERRVESFSFNPNTVTLEELERLGLSPRQAEVIEKWRKGGGRFTVKEDFRKMYVVSDTLYARLEPFIDIPKVELNSADTTVLMTLKGIGPYYAKMIIQYRERLGGFFDIGQLLEVKGFDQERFDSLSGSICVDTNLIRPLKLWRLPQDSLARNPYIGSYAAKGIVRYRQVCDSSEWSVASLVSNSVISSEAASRLVHYVK